VAGKLRVPVESVACGAGTAVPVPVNATACGEPLALSTMVTVAGRAAVLCGLKSIERLQLDDGANVAPQVLVIE
jgi:hypothetical protein